MNMTNKFLFSLFSQILIISSRHACSFPNPCVTNSSYFVLSSCEEALQDTDSEVWVWLGPRRLWLAVYSCSPPLFGEGFTPCLGSVWGCGAAVPPTAHTCTLHTTHHDARRTQDSRE